jgi:hypothetical protein
LKKLLNPEGELILQTGDKADISPKEHARSLYLPGHLSFASESTMVGILAYMGFKVQTIEKYPNERFNLGRIAKELIKFVLPVY